MHIKVRIPLSPGRYPIEEGHDSSRQETFLISLVRMAETQRRRDVTENLSPFLVTFYRRRELDEDSSAIKRELDILR